MYSEAIQYTRGKDNSINIPIDGIDGNVITIPIADDNKNKNLLWR
jgi:hypothetical protein